MAENLIEGYLTDLGEIRANVPETSFYPALERLLNQPASLRSEGGWPF